MADRRGFSFPLLLLLLLAGLLLLPPCPAAATRINDAQGRSLPPLTAPLLASHFPPLYLLYLAKYPTHSPSFYLPSPYLPQGVPPASPLPSSAFPPPTLTLPVPCLPHEPLAARVLEECAAEWGSYSWHGWEFPPPDWRVGGDCDTADLINCDDNGLITEMLIDNSPIPDWQYDYR
ncbi:unnamed protein product [Closterium sp. NIES-54]